MFGWIASKATQWLGSYVAFLLAFLSIVIWALCGPHFKFSDGWSLAINTGTTIVTFLMVFVIQHSQNKDQRALHLKLDELIRSIDAARNHYMGIETADEKVLDALATTRPA